MRLANSVMVSQAENTDLGSYHQERRNSLLSQLTDRTLSATPIRWLLRTPSSKEEENDRREELYEIYQMAAEKALAQGNTRGHFELRRLDRLPETFDLASKTLDSHAFHFLDDSDNMTRLDGRRVLIVVQPGLARKWTDETDMTEYTLLSPGYVVVEDPEGPEER